MKKQLFILFAFGMLQNILVYPKTKIKKMLNQQQVKTEITNWNNDVNYIVSDVQKRLKNFKGPGLSGNYYYGYHLPAEYSFVLTSSNSAVVDIIRMHNDPHNHNEVVLKIGKLDKNKTVTLTAKLLDKNKKIVKNLSFTLTIN